VRKRVAEYQRVNKPKVMQRIGAWISRNRDKHRAYSRRTALRARYGITPEQFDEMLAKQDGKCAICLVPAKLAPRKLLVVDHCHKQGRVRGLLCDLCNHAIGNFKDSAAMLLRAIEYLKANS
jgi:hypothetical protein